MLTCERLNVTYIALQPNNKISICEPAAKPEKQTLPLHCLGDCPSTVSPPRSC